MYNVKIIAVGVLVFLLCSFSLQKKKNIYIVFIGDSITHGARLSDPATEAPPAQATAYLREQPGIGEVEFSNQGVSGFTTVDFLPSTNTVFNKVIKAADAWYKDKHALLVFSIMLGTNDSAVKGPHGSPVSQEAYKANMKAIVDALLAAYPRCKVVIHDPIWYSPNTYNGAQYLQEGLTRLQSYFPEINALVADYAATHAGHVFMGDQAAFRYFEQHHLTDLQPESGHAGTFYLHPDKQGASALGHFWATAIYEALMKK